VLRGGPRNKGPGRTCDAKNGTVGRVELENPERQDEVRELVVKTRGREADRRAGPRVAIELLPLSHSRFKHPFTTQLQQHHVTHPSLHGYCTAPFTHASSLRAVQCPSPAHINTQLHVDTRTLYKTGVAYARMFQKTTYRTRIRFSALTLTVGRQEGQPA